MRAAANKSLQLPGAEFWDFGVHTFHSGAGLSFVIETVISLSPNCRGIDAKQGHSPVPRR